MSLDKFDTIEVQGDLPRADLRVVIAEHLEAQFEELVKLHVLRIDGEIEAEDVPSAALFAAIREVCGDEVFKYLVERAERLEIEFRGVFGVLVERL